MRPAAARPRACDNARQRMARGGGPARALRPDRSQPRVNVSLLFRPGDPLAAAAGAVIVPAVAGAGEPRALSGLAAELDRRLDGELARLAADARFTGRVGATLLVPTLGRLPATRVVLAGVGPAADLTAEAVRRAWAAATTAAREAGAAEVVSALPP